MNATAQKDITIKPAKPFDPVAALIRHWFKIVVFGGSLFLLLSPLAFMFSSSYYQVSGKMVVLPVSESMISRTDENSIASYYNQFISTQLDVLDSPKILEKAVDSLPENIKKYYMPEGMSLSLAGRILSNGLSVNQPRGTHFIDITLLRDSPEGMARMVNTIMEVYIDEYQKEEEGKDHRRLSFLETEKESLNRQIEEKTAHLKKISEEIASSVFSGNNDEASQFQSAYQSAYRDRLEKEKKLEAVTREAETLKNLSLDAYIQEKIAQNDVVSRLDILSLESLHKLNNSKVGLADDNPGKHQLEERMKDIKEYTDEQKELIREDTQKLLYKKRETELKEKIIHAQTELNAAKMIEDEILDRSIKLRAERAEIAAKDLTRKQIEASLEQMKNHLNRVDNRIYELKLESKAPGKIRLERMADSSGIISGSNLNKLVIMIFLFAFGFITSGCILFDILDNRIRVEKDILNSLGTLPHRPVEDYLQVRLKQSPFSRVLLDDPTNPVAQAIHSLAIKLDKERKGHNAKTAVFTGVDAKSGVTEILLNTAYAMSKLCTRVLVIETNFANPSILNLIKSDGCEKGLLDFIKGKAPISQYITRDKERGIDILLAGHLPSNDELVNLDRSKISKLLEQCRKKYDFILIDTMPMLISDLAEFLIVQADIVPLVVQGDRSLYKFTYLAGQTLFKLEVPAIAAVLNLGAPRYKTKIQETVFKLLWPVQQWIKTNFFRVLHPAPDQPYQSLNLLGRQAAKNGISFFRQAKKIFNAKVIINACKSIFVLFLFVQLTLMVTFISSTANVETNNTNAVIEKTDNTVTEAGFELEDKTGVSALHTRDMDQPESEIIYDRDADDSMEEVKTPSPYTPMESRGEQSPSESRVMSGQWLMNQKKVSYTIQLISSADLSAIHDFFNSFDRKDNCKIYHKQNNGLDWYSITYGLYPTYEKAQEELELLPKTIFKISPRIQSVKLIQRSIMENDSY